jgi:uncharacterized protein (TIGR02391 family)
VSGQELLELPGDEVVAMSIDELALRILMDVDQNPEWNWHNWMGRAHNRYTQHLAAEQAFSEGWGWLHARGLVAWDPRQSSDNAFIISRRGRQVLKEGPQWLRATERLDVELVPALEYTSKPHFLRGDFETAAFVAMKEVEVAVRTKAKLPNTLLGVGLMQQAFRPSGANSDGGPLFNPALEGGEAVAQMNLFAGAIGLFKNPTSHRRVDYEDPTLAAEVVLLADLLLRLIDTDATDGLGDQADDR